MSNTQYAWATWRIKVFRGVHVDVCVKGSDHESDIATADQAFKAAKILGELSYAVKRIRDKWARAEDAQ